MSKLVPLFALLVLSGCADLKHAGQDIGHATKKTTTAIGHATRDATREIGHASRDAVKSVKEELE
ncbi:hypothetical protein L9G15_12205 [Shewanella sp. A3A]|uniref:Lipoprotein n=1 Tax=Shewanella electrica TaxID=515560 RepID=A0ABT2FJ00_9GAMM|nr:hypothetical protein [Shewanella electrica]MCH1920189.1 hypothetical protein [Shewanella ferrihydritica]MCH1924407.1 hypothetical protein [Shewanella electrica]MCS4556308.1 hypothetical protein [Shewanella electrica]